MFRRHSSCKLAPRRRRSRRRGHATSAGRDWDRSGCGVDGKTARRQGESERRRNSVRQTELLCWSRWGGSVEAAARARPRRRRVGGDERDGRRNHGRRTSGVARWCWCGRGRLPDRPRPLLRHGDSLDPIIHVVYRCEADHTLKAFVQSFYLWAS